MSKIKAEQNERIPVLTFSSLLFPELTHGVFCRHGGVSSGPFDSLNASFGVGDSDENVRQNRALMKERLGIDILISAVQVHGDKVLSIKETPRQDREIAGYDAIVTDRPIGIMIQQADCQAVPLFDRTRKVIGLAHSGWRGSVADIIGKTVKVMHTEFGSDPRNIIAAISPALGPCCAEFVNYRQELPAWMHEYESRENHFDFRRISRFQLLQAGIPAENIEISSICTRCNQDYFSYRREKVTGRFATVIALNKSYTHRA